MLDVYIDKEAKTCSKAEASIRVRQLGQNLFCILRININQSLMCFTNVEQVLAAASILCEADWTKENKNYTANLAAYKALFLKAYTAARNLDKAKTNPISGLSWQGEPLPF